MNVLVAGAGAVGGWLGARLHASGVDVSLLGRPALATAVARDGLQVRGLTDLTAHVPVITTPGGGPFDVVFVTCKAHATADLMDALAPVIGKATCVSMQNGLGNAETMQRHLPASRIAVVVHSHGVTVEAPGRLYHAGTGPVRVGAAVAGAAAPAAVTDLLDAAGLAPQQVDDVTGHLWLKGAVNAGINPLCALHGIRNGALHDHWQQATTLVEEIRALSRAAGVRLPGDAQAALAATVEATAGNKCSMLQDVEARRPTEIDHITGYFVRVARRLGYPLFENEDVYRQLKALEATYLGGDAATLLTRRAAEAFVAPAQQPETFSPGTGLERT